MTHVDLETPLRYLWTLKTLLRSRFRVDVRTKDVYEFIAAVIASDAAVKVANIILDAFISRNATKPLWDAAVLFLLPTAVNAWNAAAFVDTLARKPARGALRIKARKRYSDIFLDSALSHAGQKLCVLLHEILRVGKRKTGVRGNTPGTRCLKGHNVFTPVMRSAVQTPTRNR